MHNLNKEIEAEIVSEYSGYTRKSKRIKEVCHLAKKQNDNVVNFVHQEILICHSHLYAGTTVPKLTSPCGTFVTFNGSNNLEFQ